jgi:hypothetical protein
VTTRREFLRNSAAGLVLASLGTGLAWVSPAVAASAAAPFQMLSPDEGAWISALGEAIAPPSREAGLAHYIDHHLAVPHADSLLAVRYLDVLPPYADFYRPSLASLMRAFGSTPPGDAQFAKVLDALSASTISGWAGPPSALFLFALRLDAIDIAYGTKAGFARLGVDYLPHIEPETDW